MTVGRATKIVCTLGPASSSEERLRELVAAGMDVARLNFSHGSQEEFAPLIACLRRLAAEAGRPLHVLQDLQGPKIRVGPIASGAAVLRPGAAFTITVRRVPGSDEEVSTTYAALPADVRPGSRLLLDDGLLELHAVATSATDVRCEVVRGGTLHPHKGINLPGVAVSAPAVTEKDLADLHFGLRQGVDSVACSFVRRAEDVAAVRQSITAAGARTPVIAKLEKPEAMEALEAIVQSADGVMVARGDLAVELTAEDVPVLQKRIIECASRHGRVVITATQMLESMVHSPTPTRAEATDVANAIFDGSDAVMLSAETAVGEYPVEAVQIMSRIAQRAEASGLPIHTAYAGRPLDVDPFRHAVCRAAARAAAELDARALVVFTRSGRSALAASKFRPRVPILGLTPHTETARQMAFYWGVRPIIVPELADTESLIAEAERRAVASGLAAPGDVIVVTGHAPIAAWGETNMLKLHKVGG